MKNFFYASLLLVSLIFTFGYGVGVGTYNWFPYDLIKQVKFLASGSVVQEFDALGRLVHRSKHTEVNCPEQNERVCIKLDVGNTKRFVVIVLSQAELELSISVYIPL